jgi:hypothetical protein
MAELKPNTFYWVRFAHILDHHFDSLNGKVQPALFTRFDGSGHSCWMIIGCEYEVVGDIQWIGDEIPRPSRGL